MEKNISWIKIQKVTNLSLEGSNPAVSFILAEAVEKDKAIKARRKVRRQLGKLKKKTAHILRIFCRLSVSLWYDSLESLEHRVHPPTNTSQPSQSSHEKYWG